MSPAEDNGPERGGDDLLAAEYVLGVLPASERADATARIGSEPDFARRVDEWEVRLAPMASAYGDTPAPAAVKAAIDRRLFSETAQRASQTPAPATGSLWSSLAFWRGLAVAAVAALAIYIAIPFVNAPAPLPQARLVASLAADGSDVKYLAFYDPANGDVGLSHVSGERGAGHDFELWMIEGGNAPVSIGVIPVGATTHVAISDAARQKLASGAKLAVSLEPQGGSPTGQPTGPVVAAGDLKSI